MEVPVARKVVVLEGSRLDGRGGGCWGVMMDWRCFELLSEPHIDAELLNHGDQHGVLIFEMA